MCIRCRHGGRPDAIHHGGHSIAAGNHQIDEHVIVLDGVLAVETCEGRPGASHTRTGLRPVRDDEMAIIARRLAIYHYPWTCLPTRQGFTDFLSLAQLTQ